MSNDMNVVVLVGRLTRDAELKYANSGTAVCKFSLAVGRYAGQGKDDEVSYFDTTVYGAMAEKIHGYLLKGRQVCVSGQLRQSRWEQDGQNRSKVEVVANTVQLLGNKGDHQANDGPAYTQPSQHQSAPARQEPVLREPVQQSLGGFANQNNGWHDGSQGPESFDDDIPF